MAEKTYVCLRCQRKFIVDVITAIEARKDNLNVSAIDCPDCHMTDVKPISEIEG